MVEVPRCRFQVKRDRPAWEPIPALCQGETRGNSRQANPSLLLSGGAVQSHAARLPAGGPCELGAPERLFRNELASYPPAVVVRRRWTSIRSKRPGGGSATGHMLTCCASRWRRNLQFTIWPGCPTRSCCPAPWAWNLVALGEARARGERTGSPISIEGSLLVNTSHVWAAYREGKTIYTIEPALADCLARFLWLDRTPTVALRLPSRCPVLALRWKGKRFTSRRPTILVTGADESGALDLRIVKHHPTFPPFVSFEIPPSR
jgi:hypothetical protein